MTTSSEERAIIEQLASVPRYTVRLRPRAENIQLDILRLHQLVQETGVQLRGWDLPHLHGAANAVDHIFNAVDWGMHLEFWRLYRSGQFVTSTSFWDIRDDIQKQLREAFDAYVVAMPEEKKSVSLLVSFVGMIYSVTEFYLFAARLAKALGIVDFALELSLKNVENIALMPGERGVPWSAYYRSSVAEIRLPTADSHEIVADPLAVSAVALKEIFQCFQWNNSEPAIRHWQEKFMAGRFAF